MNVQGFHFLFLTSLPPSDYGRGSGMAFVLVTNESRKFTGPHNIQTPASCLIHIHLNAQYV